VISSRPYTATGGNERGLCRLALPIRWYRLDCAAAAFL